MPLAGVDGTDRLGDGKKFSQGEATDLISRSGWSDFLKKKKSVGTVGGGEGGKAMGEKLPAKKTKVGVGFFLPLEGMDLSSELLGNWIFGADF